MKTARFSYIYTDEEDAFIENHAASRKIEWIAEQLGRPVHGLRVHMIELGISSLHEEAGTYSAKMLGELIGVSYETIRRWIRLKKLPARKRSRYRDTAPEHMHYHISVDDFWEWAEKYKDLVEFHKFDSHALPPEPSWVEVERKKQRKKPPKQQTWTLEQDKEVWRLYYSGMKQKDIAERMNRTQNSIDKRLKRLRETGGV